MVTLFGYLDELLSAFFHGGKFCSNDCVMVEIAQQRHLDKVLMAKAILEYVNLLLGANVETNCNHLYAFQNVDRFPPVPPVPPPPPPEPPAPALSMVVTCPTH